MPLLPDSFRQQLAPVVKYHFWLLVPLVPLLLMPAVFLANSRLKTTIARQKATIDGHVSSLGAIRGEQDHPNDAWVETFDGRTRAVRDELLKEWQALWESQESLRAWPEQELGPDFMASIDAVESGGRRELTLSDLQIYQNKVPDLVRQLPGRMGCEEMMTDGDGKRRPGPPGGRGGAAPGKGDNPEAFQQFSPLEWRAEDQKRLSATFRWNKDPTTTQVLLAQEELWVYGLFCDTIRRMNEGAKGAFDASITTVDQLAVGYLAAEDKPGGIGTGRIMTPRDAETRTRADDGLPADREQDKGLPALQPRPPHPRFSAGGFDGRGLPAAPASTDDGDGAAAPKLTLDDHLKQWIYVDFTSRPLTSVELATAPDAQLVHLMPFLLRVTIDQRQIDRLLADLAANPIPIDVRQVRINPQAQAGGAGAFGRSGGLDGSGPSAAGDRRRRAFDVTLELRGTVGLATPPNAATLGASGAGGQPAAEGEGA